MFTKALKFISWKTKYWVGREIDYYKVNPKGAIFFLTYRCTSRCKTCSMWKRNDGRKEMNLEGWKNAVKMCYEMGVRTIELFGGDALLRKDILVDLAKYIKSFDGLACDLTTNCNLMDQELADGLVKAGVDDIWVSMDGVAMDHDKIRGHSGTFERVERGIKFLTQAKGMSSKPCLHANCTISKHNARSFDKLPPYVENMGMNALHLEYVGEFWQETLDKSNIEGIKPSPYFVRDGGESCLANSEEAHLIKNKVMMMKKQWESKKVELRTENIDKLTIENMIKGRFENKKCYRIRRKITIDPSGNVLACPFYDGWKMGNTQEQRLQNIWKNDKHKKFMDTFKKGDFQFCNYCVLGVQRNNTIFQDMKYEVKRILGKVRM